MLNISLKAQGHVHVQSVNLLKVVPTTASWFVFQVSCFVWYFRNDFFKNECISIKCIFNKDVMQFHF